MDAVAPALSLSLEPLFLGDQAGLVHDIVDNKPVFEQYVFCCTFR